MKNHESLFFVGIDWNREFHQVCVVDHKCSPVGEKAFRHFGGVSAHPRPRDGWNAFRQRSLIDRFHVRVAVNRLEDAYVVEFQSGPNLGIPRVAPSNKVKGVREMSDGNLL